MKNLATLLLYIFLISCGESSNENYSISKKKCSKTINIEKVEICLPEIDGMKECLNDDKIKNDLNNIGANYSTNNSNVALYISNEIYENPELHFGELFEDYFIISTVKDQQMKVSNEEFVKVCNEYKSLNKEFLVKWDEIKEKVNKSSKVLKLSDVIVLKSYSLNDNVVSTLMLFQNEYDNKVTYYITIGNIALIKNHVIYYNYKKKYTDEKSLLEAQSKNDFYSLMLIQNN